MITKDDKMENDASIIAVATLACTGAIGWLKSSLNNTDKAQRALELHIAEHHMTKDDVKEFVELTNQPIKQQMDSVSTQVASVDGKLDQLLNRGK